MSKHTPEAVEAAAVTFADLGLPPELLAPLAALGYEEPTEIQAQAILKALPTRDEHGKEAVPHLQDAIKHCTRVAELGDKVDPGASLNPAVKARAAAKEAMKHLMAMKDGGA